MSRIDIAASCGSRFLLAALIVVVSLPAIARGDPPEVPTIDRELAPGVRYYYYGNARTPMHAVVVDRTHSEYEFRVAASEDGDSGEFLTDSVYGFAIDTDPDAIAAINGYNWTCAVPSLCPGILRGERVVPTRSVVMDGRFEYNYSVPAMEVMIGFAAPTTGAIDLARLPRSAFDLATNDRYHHFALGSGTTAMPAMMDGDCEEPFGTRLPRSAIGYGDQYVVMLSSDHDISTRADGIMHEHADIPDVCWFMRLHRVTDAVMLDGNPSAQMFARGVGTPVNPIPFPSPLALGHRFVANAIVLARTRPCTGAACTHDSDCCDGYYCQIGRCAELPPLPARCSPLTCPTGQWCDSVSAACESCSAGCPASGIDLSYCYAVCRLCSNGVRDPAEVGLDCGGPCSPCGALDAGTRDSGVSCPGSASGPYDIWTCTPDLRSRQRCHGGTTQTEPCPLGCVRRAFGFDDYCDSSRDAGPPDAGAVDASTSCTGGSMRPCYGGPAGTLSVGTCSGGAQLCSGGLWGATCFGETLPQPENCLDGLDNDCDRATDCADPDCSSRSWCGDAGMDAGGVSDAGPRDGGAGVCAPFAVATCYDGPSGSSGVGLCHAGSHACVADGSGWGACLGERLPVAELCNDADDDCNGLVDDGPAAASCPSRANATPICASGLCTFACMSGFADCDLMVSNGCEIDTRASLTNCGSCGRACLTGAGLLSWCADGICDASCATGRGDCNSTYADGCEIDLMSDGSNCGWCGHVCSARTACASGTCSSACPSGTTYCSGSCVNTTTDPVNCGACGVGAAGSCTVPAARGPCAAGSLACVSGTPTCVGTVSPSVEICNGIDNDCDGSVDDGDPGGGVSCSTGALGACAPGTLHCRGGSLRCEPFWGPMGETCDGTDNDCNGLVDDGLGSTPCGAGACRRSVTNCIGGVTQACVPGVPSTESCGNAIDDDCDGTVDDGCVCTPGALRACYTSPATRGVGACRDGSQTCIAGTAWGPCAGEIGPGAEACNGTDDDCDGLVDDAIAPRPCYSGPGGTVGVGACHGGTESCSASVWGICVGESLPSAEVCDGLDNNCNGVIDEGCACTVGTTRACYGGPIGTSDVGPCHGGTQTCGTGGWGACGGDLVPTAEGCNRVDDDCDGTIDERHLHIALSPSIQGECPGGWMIEWYDDTGTAHRGAQGLPVEIDLPPSWSCTGTMGFSARCPSLVSMCGGTYWRDWTPWMNAPAGIAGVASIVLEGADRGGGDELADAEALVCDFFPSSPTPCYWTTPRVPLDASFNYRCSAATTMCP